MHNPCALRLTITFPLAATDSHMHTMETAGKSGGKVGNSWQFHANSWSFVTAQRSGDKCFTIMMNTSLGDVPCPAGCKMRTLHTYSHMSFTLSLTLAVFCPPIMYTNTHTHINSHWHTDAQPNVPTWTLSSMQKQTHSISSLYILKYRMETEIKLNKTLGAEAGLV